MFGPNTQITGRLSIDSNHRSAYAEGLVIECRSLFQEMFGLSAFDILFIPGSASIGMEALIASLRSDVKVMGMGRFADRWRDVAAKYVRGTSFFTPLYCHLETSESRLNSFPIEDGIVDAVSSFPFFPLPSCWYFVTSVNKQLGCPAGISIVGVRKSAWRRVQDASWYSYTNLRIWKDAAPVTFPIYVLEFLKKNLLAKKHLSVARRIRSVCRILRKGIDPSSVVGETLCPVITLKEESVPPSLVEKYQLYRSIAGYQVFTYSCPVRFYQRFVEDLQKCS